MRPFRPIFSPLLAVLSCLACGSACLALPAAHHATLKHPRKPLHAGALHKTAALPVALQSVPLPAELAGHGSYIMAMCTDHNGVTYLGTEEQGIFSYDQRQPYKSRWHHWTTADGLGDNTCYCLCVDSKNRVFAGTNNSGLNVWSGKSWRNFSQLDGPLGAHLYAMAVSPVTGSVFMACEAGLSVYKEERDTWQYILAPMGRSLPQATSLTFNKAGDLILGSQTDGIYIGRAASGFEHWDHIAGPEFMPRSASGSGLPSGDINCLLTARDGTTIWAGTRCGIAVSVDSGNHWGYFRGADYADKVNGLYSGKAYDATLAGLELLTEEQYQKFITAPAAAKSQTVSNPPAGAPHAATVPTSWIALDAADDPGDQMGVHITVTGGTTSKSQADIDTSKTVRPAPAELYRDERQGNFTYMFQNLAPSRTYMLRFHFAELNYFGPGERQFLVTANGTPALPPMDVFEKAGGCDIALTQDVPVKTNAYGVLVLAFAGLRQEVSEPPSPAPAANQMLSQDYVTSLSQGADGRVFIGHWQGLESYNPATQSFQPEGQTAAPAGQIAGFVSSLLPLQYGGVLVGGYGNGLSYAGLNSNSFQHQAGATAFPTSQTVELPFPSPAKPPTTQKLRELATELAKSGQPDMKPGDGAYLGADWATRGNWIGRLGQKYTVMFAADSPFNHTFVNDFDYSADGDLGPNRQPYDSVRRWLHWLRTDDPRVMTDPVTGSRRESELDDHGEDYDIRIEGPDLWITVKVPAGVHRLSAYFMNKDGQGGSNEYRDYDIYLLPYRTDPRASAFLKPLAVGRVRQFWGGCYQSFAVCGPAKFYLKIARSNSFNTIVSAILLDKIFGPPTKWEIKDIHSPFEDAPEYWDYITPPASRVTVDGLFSSSLPIRLWASLSSASGNVNWCPAVIPARMLCYRALSASSLPGSASMGEALPTPQFSGNVPTYLGPPAIVSKNDLLAWWRRSLPFVSQSDREAYHDVMTRAWKDELIRVPALSRDDL